VGTPTQVSGVEAYDIGTLRTGYATLEVYGAPAGTPIQITYSDKANSSGLPDTSGCCIKDQTIQTDYYVSNGKGTEAVPELFTPQFTVKASRYIEISGVGGTALPAGVHVALKNFTEVRAAMPQTGTFTSSDSVIDKTYAATQASIAANYFGGIVTDTPEYEKNPWQGDTSLSSTATDLIFDADAYDGGEVQDQVDCQNDFGELVQLCPNSGTYGYLFHSPDGGFVRGPSTGSTPIWDSAAFTVPWNQYMVSGDTSLLTKSSPEMEKYLDDWMPQFGRLSGADSDYIVTSALGDWDPPSGVDGTAAEGTNITVPSNNASSSTAYYAYLAEIASWTAQALGDKAAAGKYATLHDEIAAAFNKQWWNPSLGYYDETAANGVGDATSTEPFEQTINAVALAFNLVPGADRKELEAKLVNDILVTRSGHEEVGIVGAAWLLPVLSQASADGFADAAEAAYALVSQTSYPSYGYWTTTLGWTGLGEIWENTSRTQSHEMFGSVGAWMYEGLAGLATSGGLLDPDPSNPAFKEITFAPTIPKGLSTASATEKTAKGTAAASWTVADGTLTMQETVPSGSTGVVYVPATDKADVKHTGPGVVYVGVSGDRLVYRIGSGKHTFHGHRVLRVASTGSASGSRPDAEPMRIRASISQNSSSICRRVDGKRGRVLTTESAATAGLRGGRTAGRGGLRRSRAPFGAGSQPRSGGGGAARGGRTEPGGSRRGHGPVPGHAEQRGGGVAGRRRARRRTGAGAGGARAYGAGAAAGRRCRPGGRAGLREQRTARGAGGSGRPGAGGAPGGARGGRGRRRGAGHRARGTARSGGRCGGDGRGPRPGPGGPGPALLDRRAHRTGVVQRDPAGLGRPGSRGRTGRALRNPGAGGERREPRGAR
jgi:hypothetical protein